jgi:hypothetical protein
MYALVVVSFLTNRLKLCVFYVKNLAYILKKTSNSANPDELLFKTIATATLQRDRLFHIDDSTKFLDIEKIKDVTSRLNYAVSDQPYLQYEFKYGSARVFHSVGNMMLLNKLQWLHIRPAHANEYQIKMMVLHNVNIGTQSYAEIKDLHLSECDT